MRSGEGRNGGPTQSRTCMPYGASSRPPPKSRSCSSKYRILLALRCCLSADNPDHGYWARHYNLRTAYSDIYLSSSVAQQSPNKGPVMRQVLKSTHWTPLKSLKKGMQMNVICNSHCSLSSLTLWWRLQGCAGVSFQHSRVRSVRSPHCAAGLCGLQRSGRDQEV